MCFLDWVENTRTYMYSKGAIPLPATRLCFHHCLYESFLLEGTSDPLSIAQFLCYSVSGCYLYHRTSFGAPKVIAGLYDTNTYGQFF